MTDGQQGSTSGRSETRPGVHGPDRIPRALFVGTFFPDRAGRRGPAHDLTIQLAAAGWPLLTVSRHRNRIVRASDILTTVWRKRRAYDVAVVDVFSGKAFALCEAVVRALRLAGKPHVLNLQGGGLVGLADASRTRVGRLLAAAEAVVAPTGYIADGLRPLRSGIEVIPNGIRISDYPFRLRETALPRLVWVRGFHAIYAPWVAVETVRRLRDLGHDPRLSMVGADLRDGSLARVRSQIQRAGLTDHVEIVGPVAKGDVPQWLDAADVFLNTTTLESFGVATVEAMACGLCVVSTDVGGIPFVVSDGEDGLLVPAGDSSAMAQSIDRVVREPGLSARLSRGARTKSEAYDWSNIVVRWQMVLQGVARRP